jgi:hypothetical protein
MGIQIMEVIRPGWNYEVESIESIESHTGIGK